MDERCENCRTTVVVENLKEEVAFLKEEVSKLKITTTKNEEQTKMVFKILNEIKDSIKDIAIKFENIEKQPGEEYSKIKLAILTSICSGGIGTLLGFIFSK